MKSQNWEFDGRHVCDFAMRNLRLLNFFAWRRRTFIQEAKDSTVSQLLLVSQWLFVMPARNGGHYVNHTDDRDWQPFTDIHATGSFLALQTIWVQYIAGPWTHTESVSVIGWSMLLVSSLNTTPAEEMQSVDKCDAYRLYPSCYSYAVVDLTASCHSLKKPWWGNTTYW